MNINFGLGKEWRDNKKSILEARYKDIMYKSLLANLLLFWNYKKLFQLHSYKDTHINFILTHINFNLNL